MASRQPKTAVGFEVLARVNLSLPYGEIEYDDSEYSYEYENKDSYGRPTFPYRSKKVPRTPETPVGQVQKLGDKAINWRFDPQEVRVQKKGNTVNVVFGESDGSEDWEDYLVIRLDRAIKTLDAALKLEAGKALPKVRNLPRVTRATSGVYVIEAPCGDVFAVRKETLRNFAAALKKAQKAIV